MRNAALKIYTKKNVECRGLERLPKLARQGRTPLRKDEQLAPLCMQGLLTLDFQSLRQSNGRVLRRATPPKSWATRRDCQPADVHPTEGLAEVRARAERTARAANGGPTADIHDQGATAGTDQRGSSAQVSIERWQRQPRRERQTI